MAKWQIGNGGFRKSIAKMWQIGKVAMLILKNFATLPLHDFFENLYSLRTFFKLTKNYETMMKIIKYNN